MTIYIECTHTYLYGGNTGIQRVTRNLANRAPAIGASLDVECIPIVWTGREFIRVRGRVGVEPQTAIRFGRALYKTVRDVKHRLRRLWDVGLRRDQTSQMVGEPRNRKMDWKTGLVERSLAAIEFGLRPIRISPEPGDILLLVDASWISPGILSGLDRLKGAGVVLGSVIYDLIPITHPDFLSNEHVAAFSWWLDGIVDRSDFVIGISRDVADQMSQNLSDRGLEVPVGSFRLGTDLDSARNRISTPHVRDRASFTVVGTIEPRKNHQLILDAFDILWSEGVDATLTIIGRYGWMASEVAQRIQDHPRFGRELIWRRDLDDAKLLDHYRSCTALISSSITEGFGLPVVEALSLGSPVIASDIPTHREIGGQLCTYFDPLDSTALADAIRDHIEGKRSRVIESFSWPTWDESTREFLEVAMKLSTEAVGTTAK